MARKIAGVLFLFTSLAFPARNLEAQQTILVKPPVAPVRPVTDDYFDTKVVDNYRYMENLNDPDVQAWFKSQDVYTQTTLDPAPANHPLGRWVSAAQHWEIASGTYDIMVGLSADDIA